jgi:uncharacterized protein
VRSVLLGFRVANHKSIRDEQELLLLPAYDKGRDGVPVAAIYGANASGKSNVLDGLRFMRRAVLDSFRIWEPGGGVPRAPFALTAQAREEESQFSVTLLIEGQRYVYGFTADDERITGEWLYHYPHGRRRVLFEREGQDFRFGDSLRGPRATVEEVTRANSLFLSAAAQHGLSQLAPVHEWFSTGLRFATSRGGRRRTEEVLQGSPEQAERITALLGAADLGIEAVRVEEGPDPLLGLRWHLSESFPVVDTKILERLDRFTGRQRQEPTRPSLTGPRASGNRRGTSLSGSPYEALVPPTTQVLFRHAGADEDTFVSFDDESHGARTWFSYLGPIVDTLDRGGVLVVDEIDSSLHPHVVRAFITLFQDEKTNPNAAQLLCTTHDTSLLGRPQGEELLRRDEVWFTEKDRDGATTLFPLTDFHPRSGLNWERRYLGGAVGAVPIIDPAELSGGAAHG